MREISDMAPEKIAEPQKLLNFLDIRWRWGVFHGFEFVCARDYALLGEAEAKVRNLLASKHTFLKVDLMLCVTRRCNTLLKVAICSSWEAECTNKSSMYTITFSMFLTTVSMSLWKLAGHPSRPMGLVTH